MLTGFAFQTEQNGNICVHVCIEYLCLYLN